MKLSELKKYDVVGTGSTILEKPTIKKTVGQKVLDAGTSVAKFFGAEGISEQFGADLAKLKAPKNQKQFVTYPSQKKVIGSAIQTGANLLPGAGKGVGLVGKAIAGGATGYAFDVGSKLQSGDKDPLTPGIGTAVGVGLPVAGAVIRPAVKIVGRLLKGLGTGVSGVSVKNIEAILSNPKQAQKVSDKIAKVGASEVLEQEAKTILNGVSTIKTQARKAFGEGLEQLSKTDIDDKVFRQNTQAILDKYGSVKEAGVRTLKNVEFDDPKNIQKASSLIDKIAKAELDGKSLRKLADDIESAGYKIATTDERLSFNAFVKDLSNSLKGAVSASTDKLDEINKAFSKDIQLAEATEQIFGKVKFKNLTEVLKASQKLEKLFSQSGLAPDVVDDFLTRIGVSPEDFKTSEAVRQITEKVTGANTKGLSVGELIQQVTSAVVTPQMVKNISIFAGIAEDKLGSFLSSISTPARNVLINALLQETQGSQEPQQ